MIYLDHNATTPVAPEVREAMLPFLSEEWENESSTCRLGAKAMKPEVGVSRQTIRFSLGTATTSADVTTAGEATCRAAAARRG